MSKQFSIIATPEDFQTIDQMLRERGDVTFLSTRAIAGTTDLIQLESIQVPSDKLGTHSLFCFLTPSQMPLKLMVKRISDVKVSVNINSSNVIDLWRSFFDGYTIKPGRMYYQNKVLVDGKWFDKDQDFCIWADDIMTATKKVLIRDKNLGAYIGQDAAKRLNEGNIFLKE